MTVTYEDTKSPGAMHEASADWCVCTIPLSILSQIEINVGAPMQAAIGAVPYVSSVKVGLQFKRRFWEEDDLIFGGISYTDLPITQISYPSTGYNTTGKGVLLGCYTWNGPNSYEFTAMSPEERVKRAVEYGSQIHPQYKQEFENGIAVAWHRSPFTLGCAGDWTDEAQEAALQQSLPDRRAHRAGRRARLVHSGLAGRGHPVVARCDHAPASTRAAGVTAMTQPTLPHQLREARRHDPANSARPASLFRGRVFRRHVCRDRPHLPIPPGRRSAPASKFTEQTGEALYANVCQACHMDQGAGGHRRRANIRRWPRTRSWTPAAMRSPSSCTGRTPCRRSAR